MNLLDLSKYLKRRFILALLVTIGVFMLLVTATFAWYIYNTSAHTTDVNMAVGSGANLNISNAVNGQYGYSAVLDKFVGSLDPVSTDKITNGFQKVYEFEDTDSSINGFMASVFGSVETTDYYKTSLFLKTTGKGMNVYVADIGYEDNDKKNPLSTATRVGLVVYKPGSNTEVQGEYVYEINTAKNPQAHFNTKNAKNGEVLDSTRKDGRTVTFKPYSSKNFCIYDSDTGRVTLKDDSVSIATVKGAGDGEYGKAVKVDVYIWLEGCDADCFNNLAGKGLKNISLSFAGKVIED